MLSVCVHLLKITDRQFEISLNIQFLIYTASSTVCQVHKSSFVTEQVCVHVRADTSVMSFFHDQFLFHGQLPLVASGVT